MADEQEAWVVVRPEWGNDMHGIFLTWHKTKGDAERSHAGNPWRDFYVIRRILVRFADTTGGNDNG